MLVLVLLQEGSITQTKKATYGMKYTTRIVSMIWITLIVKIATANPTACHMENLARISEDIYSDTIINNVISGICNCSYVQKKLYVNCSNRNISYIPDLQTDTHRLEITSTNIKSITNNPFKACPKIHYIDLSINPLKYISNETFAGLSELRVLKLYNTDLKLQRNLVLDLMLKDLKSLEEFSFFSVKHIPYYPNFCEHKYPRFGYSTLVTFINKLEISRDLLRWTKQELIVMRPNTTQHLKVVLDDFCMNDTFTVHDFKNMPNLKTLEIYFPKLFDESSHIKRDALSNLSQLLNLTVFAKLLPFFTSTESINQFVTAASYVISLDSLNFTHLSQPIGWQRCREYFSFLKKLNISTFVFERNYITVLSTLQCPTFSPSLQSLYLGNNCMELYEVLLDIIYPNPQLTYVNVYNQSCPRPYHLKENRNDALNVFENKTQHRLEKKSAYQLETLILTYSKRKLGLDGLCLSDNVTFFKLRHLDLSWSVIPETKLPVCFAQILPALYHLDLTGIGLREIPKNSLLGLYDLTYLFVSHNALGNSGCNLTKHWKGMHSVKILRLNKNEIECIPTDMFKFTESLEVINLSNNSIRQFDPEINHLTRLNILDVSNNKIETLSPALISNLEAVNKQHTLVVNLTGNNFLCTCDSLYFVRWLKETTVHLPNIELYTCILSNGDRKLLRHINSIVQELDSSCSSNLVIILCSSIGGASVFVCMIVFLTYKNRWKLRYIYFSAKLKMPTYQHRTDGYESMDYEHDAFISYAEEDQQIGRFDSIERLEVGENLRLFIHERDFVPGQAIGLNVIKGIRESRKTVLLLSREFLQSEWCMYELNMAKTESMFSKRDIILVVMLEQIPSKDIPLDVLDIIRMYTYLEYPVMQNEANIDVFWQKCADFVKG